LFDDRSIDPKPDGVEFADALSEADALLAGKMQWFGHHHMEIASPPDWFLDPFSGMKPDGALHWSQIGDFDSRGDIKSVWEPSRFDWALQFARAYRLTGRKRYFQMLNAWCLDWQRANAVNTGPNWRCGQETAIRMLTVLLAAYLLGQHQQPTVGLLAFVRDHCRRIAATRGYALAQDNNHAISEAVGLFVGGSWLARNSPSDATRAARWGHIGRRQVEDCVKCLVSPDGSFSQYSLNYHRVLLDMLSMAEFWRRELGRGAWCQGFIERVRAAVMWLHAFVDPVSGDAPNLGGNDGAMLFRLHSRDYRDYRPSVQLASALYEGSKVYEAGPWDDPLHWLGLGRSERQERERSSVLYADGGYVTLHSLSPAPRSWAVIRFPVYATRPAHADALHLDLWVGSVNLLRDGGTYSYAARELHDEMRSCRAHNTVELDGHDQMQTLGRFLYADWLKADHVGRIEGIRGGGSWVGAYHDRYGCRHERRVECSGNRWHIVDQITGVEAATLRWRLAPYTWGLDLHSGRCDGALASINVQSTTPIVRFQLVEGWESRYYLDLTSLPVLEVEAATDGRTLEFVTDIDLKGSA